MTQLLCGHAAAKWHPKTELLKVADVQTHVCANFLSICAKFVFLDTKQEKNRHFFFKIILAQFDKIHYGFTEFMVF